VLPWRSLLKVWEPFEWSIKANEHPYIPLIHHV
jgi:hypothetical protein